MDQRNNQMVFELGKEWLVKKGGEIKNLDIVREVCPLYRASKAKLVWVRGHNNDPGNELADYWANEARRQHLK